MVTRGETKETPAHFTKPCKKHGQQHQWMTVGEQHFCAICFGQFLEKHLGQLGVSVLCDESTKNV